MAKRRLKTNQPQWGARLSGGSMVELFSRSIHEGNVSDLVGDAKRIAEGQDSEVFKIGRRVVKRYPRLDLEQVLDYQEVTQQAKDILDGTVLDYKIRGQRPIIIINPINKVIESETNYDVFSVSSFIGGPTLNSRKHRQPTSSLFDDISRQIIQQTQFRGINIIPLNVKIQKSRRGINFVVTDICARVKDLKQI